MLHSSIHFIEVTFVFSSSEHNSLGCFYKTNDDNSRILLDFARLGIPQENLIRKSNGNDVGYLLCLQLGGSMLRVLCC